VASLGRRPRSHSLLVFAITLWVLVGAPRAPAQQLDKLDPLLRVIVTQPAGRSFVLVQGSLGALLDQLILSVGGKLGSELPLIGARAAEVPNSSILTLANSLLVQRVALDRPTGGSLERSSAAIGASTVRQETGLDGRGVGVAVIDSGITSWHDDLTAAGSPTTQRIARFVDFVNSRTSPYDDFGHGTHVAGIVGGNGYDSNGARSGIAPGVTLSVLKVLNASGQGRISHVIAALGFVIDNQSALNIRIVNVSVGAAVSESYTTDMLARATRRVAERGIVVVAAAGNLGRDSAGVTQYGGITAPGNAPWVLTVGASSHNGTVDRTDDVVAAFSSRGPTYIDRGAKPDLVAPGVGTESLSDPDSELYRSRSAYLLRGSVPTSYLPYLSLSGTSMAAPVVTGTIALMLQANPGLTPNAVKAILQYTAEPHPEIDWLTQGAGFLDAYGAVALARYTASSGGGPFPQSASWSGQVLWGNRRLREPLPPPGADVWKPAVAWGAVFTAKGSPLQWGSACALDVCSFDNIVWGPQCGGDDCGDTWTASQTVVWGTNTRETVVWGTNSRDTVVWGTTDPDPVLWSPGG